VRPFNEVKVTQGSPEWRQARCGYITGSRAADIGKTLKNGAFASGRAEYMTQLVVERLTGVVEADTPSAAMTRGTELEPVARGRYEDATGYMVLESGFLTSNQWPGVGCSLDGYIPGQLHRILEIKCPKASKMLAMMEDGKVPDEYRYQLCHNLAVTQAQSADLVLFNPDLPAHLQLYILTVLPSSIDMDGYVEKLVAFRDEVEAKVAFWKEWRA